MTASLLELERSRNACLNLTIERKTALELVEQLIAIPGKSCEEAGVAKFIVERLLAAGVSENAIRFDQVQRKSPYGGNCGNLIVKLKGTVRGPRRLLMAHLDTVPLCVGARPVRDGDVIRPRDPHTALGGDDRAGAAVVLNALLTMLNRELPHPPVTFFWPVQEEIGLIGSRYVSPRDLGNPKLCFNWDGGSASDITIGATGAYNVKAVLHGIASHAGVHPERGVSAVGIAGLAIADLVNNGWHGLVAKGRNRGTCNLGIMHAGDATNVVTDRCEILGEVRAHDEAFRRRLLKEVEKAFARAAKQLKNDAGRTGASEFHWDLKYPSFMISTDEPCVRDAERAVSSLGFTPRHVVANGGLDANFLSDRGFPTVTLGCGEKNVHTVDEVVVVEDYLNACAIGLQLACGQSGNADGD
jgi:tripeptide aminopeptidase